MLSLMLPSFISTILPRTALLSGLSSTISFDLKAAEYKVAESPSLVKEVENHTKERRPVHKLSLPLGSNRSASFSSAPWNTSILSVKNGIGICIWKETYLENWISVAVMISCLKLPLCLTLSAIKRISRSQSAMSRLSGFLIAGMIFQWKFVWKDAGSGL